MISLNTDIRFTSAYYYFLMKLKRGGAKNNKNIDEYAQAHAAKGTPEAQKADKTDNPCCKGNVNFEEITKLLRLNLPENRFAILMLLPKGELYDLMKLLGKDALLNGLKFFTKEKLLQFIWKLPKEEILKMLMHMFTNKKEILEHFPIKELKRFLSSDKIEKGHFMKIFEMMPRETLAKIMWGIDGKDHGQSSKVDLMDQFKHMKKFKMANGVKRLDYKTMRDFITNLAEKYPKLYNEFSKPAMFDVTARFAKGDLIKGLGQIDEEKIMSMLTDLPDKLLALCVSQIDPEVFSKVLVKNNQDLLLKLVGG